MSLTTDLIGLGMPPALAELLGYQIDGATIGEPIIFTTSPIVVTPLTTAIAIERSGPTSTAITFPSLEDQNGVPLTVLDWSTNVTAHTITITPQASDVIMRQAQWTMVSNASYLAIATFYPSLQLGGWFVK